MKDFIKILLKYRILFDNYVIKSESSDFNNQHWILESYSKESGLKKTFENDNNIIMLQSMLQTSFSSYSNKKWLYKLMTDINDTIKGEKTTLDVIEESSLTEYANRYAKEVIKRDGFSLNNGTNTNHFIFNYLDYLLWQEWEKVRSNQSNQSDPLLSHIAKCEDDFSKFSFRYRDSIEHIQPQTPITDDEHNSSDNYINSFGNLCLISSNSNSQYSNRGIEDKFKIFQDKRKNGVVESGKQALIMQMAKDSDNSFSWNEDKIKEHGTEMIDFLIKAINDDECEKK